jgi:hypothetical protein
LTYIDRYVLTSILSSAFVRGVGGVVGVVMLAHQTERTWQDLIVARHLFLSGGDRTSIQGYPLVSDGWRDLVERAADRIADTLAAAASGSVTLVEIKSKYATLRMYWTGAGLTKAAENTIADAIALTEARSACTCEVCGRERVHDLTSAAYASDAAVEGADLWVYGHTHETKDFMVGNGVVGNGNTRVVSNQKGYGPWAAGETWENPDFNPNFVIEI